MRRAHRHPFAHAHCTMSGTMAHLPSPALVAIMNCFGVSDVLCSLAHVNKHWNRHARAPMSFEYATWDTLALCCLKVRGPGLTIARKRELRHAGVESRLRKYAPLMHSLVVVAYPVQGPPMQGIADDSDAQILQRVMVAEPARFHRLTRVRIRDCHWDYESATAFDTNIPAMANLVTAVVNFAPHHAPYMSAYAIASAGGYAFALSPHLRSLTLIDVYSVLKESCIQSVLEPRSATLESLVVYTQCDSNRMARWLYSLCTMRALLSLRIVDSQKCDFGREPVNGAFVACLAHIRTLRSLSIVQRFQGSHSIPTLHPVDIARSQVARDVTLRISGCGFTTDGVFHSLEHLDIRALNIGTDVVKSLGAVFPVLRHLTLAEYDGSASLLLPALFEAVPALHCVTYRCEADRCARNLADVSRTLLALPDPLHTAAIGIDYVHGYGISATVRPRAVAHSRVQLAPMYSVSTPELVPAAFTPGGQSFRVALVGISASIVRSLNCYEDLMYHAGEQSANASPLIVSHMGRVPDCMQPLCN
jgi:hypothetical protein